MSGEHLDEPLDYLYEELPPERMAEVRRHLAECPECRAEMRGIRDAVKIYRLAPRPSTPPGLAARSAARALGEVAAERHAPAPAQKTRRSALVSGEEFEQEFTRLKQEVMGEMKRGWRSWFTHPAWAVATGVFLVCIILIHVSPRMNRQYEQFLPSPRTAAPQQKNVEGASSPAPAVGPAQEEEVVATEPSATLLQAETMSEPLDVVVPEPESSAAVQAESAASDEVGAVRSVGDAAPAAAKPIQAAPVTARSADDIAPPLSGRIQKQETPAPAPESPKPAPAPKDNVQEVAESPVQLRPPAQAAEAAVAMDEASTPIPQPEIPSFPESAPAAQAEAAPPAAGSAATAGGAVFHGGVDGPNLYGEEDAGIGLSEMPAGPAAVPASRADDRIAPEQSAPAPSGTSSPLDATPDFRHDRGNAPYGSSDAQPHSASGIPPLSSPEASAPSAPPPAGGLRAPEADLFAPVAPRARASAAAQDEAAVSRSPALPDYAVSPAPPLPASSPVSATDILDATGGPGAAPQIVERPTPVDRVESARNLTTLAALALAEGNIAEAWEAVRMLRSIDPKAADQVAKWITELEESKAAAESQTTDAAAEPYAIQEVPPASVPSPMETVEPPENPPLTEIQVPAHMAPPGAVPPAPAHPIQATHPAEPPPSIPAAVIEKELVKAPPPALTGAPASGTGEAPEASEEDSAEDAPAAAPASRRPGSSSLWYGTVGRDIRPLGPSRPQSPAPVMGRRPGTGKPFTTDPYLRDD